MERLRPRRDWFNASPLVFSYGVATPLIPINHGLWPKASAGHAHRQPARAGEEFNGSHVPPKKRSILRARFWFRNWHSQITRTPNRPGGALAVVGCHDACSRVASEPRNLDVTSALARNRHADATCSHERTPLCAAHGRRDLEFQEAADHEVDNGSPAKTQSASRRVPASCPYRERGSCVRSAQSWRADHGATTVSERSPCLA